MEHPIKIDDLGVPLFLETPIFGYLSYSRINQKKTSTKTNGWEFPNIDGLDRCFSP